MAATHSTIRALIAKSNERLVRLGKGNDLTPRAGSTSCPTAAHHQSIRALITKSNEALVRRGESNDLTPRTMCSSSTSSGPGLNKRLKVSSRSNFTPSPASKSAVSKPEIEREQQPHKSIRLLLAESNARLAHIGQNDVPRPIKTSAKPLISRLEVERKFLPTAYLKQILGLDTSFPRLELEPSTASSLRALHFSRLSDTIIKDTYLDADDKLSAQGIWVRQREVKNVRSEDFPCIFETSESKQLQAKVRIAGDYRDSAITELEGQQAVSAMLRARNLPGLVGLSVLADLETHRLEWMIIERLAPGAGGVPLIATLVLDRVVDAAGQGFEHEVGEVEFLATIEGGTAIAPGYVGLMRTRLAVAEMEGREHELKKREVVAKVGAELDGFMSRHAALFPKGEVLGKLSAFFAWKEGGGAGQGW